MRLRSRAAAVLGCASLVLPVGLASASEYQPHGKVVSENAADFTPQITNSGVTNPHVDAIAVLGDTTYAGGLFQQVTSGGTSYARDNVMAFTPNGLTGFNLNIEGGQIWAMEADPTSNSVYIGGDFTSVNGKSASLVKVSPTGVIDDAFKPPFSRGRVNEIEMVDGKLFVGGTFSGKLRMLNPTNGSSVGSIPTISGEVCEPVCSWGATSVYDFSIHGTKLAAVGNFASVGGVKRERFVMLNLGTSGASLNGYYHAGFDKRCATEHARRVAYLQGVDFSPDGSHFSVAATGQVPYEHSDYWHILSSSKPAAATVCDGVGRFSSTDDSKPQWINYTGGDSVWTVEDTGAAVYAQGHFQWFDNVDGYASCWKGDLHTSADAPADADCSDSTYPSGSVRRLGIAALDPDSGLALPWDPVLIAKSGGKALEATSDGLWVGNDSVQFGTERNKHGIAFAPLT